MSELYITCILGRSIADDWLDLTSHLRTESKGQHVAGITGPVGWFKYLAKHTGRGAGHYQRQRSGLPEEWQSPGRVWGKIGEWPCQDVATADVSMATFHRFRRLVRAWSVSVARAELHAEHRPGRMRERRRRLTYVRALIRCTDKHRARVVGLSQWCPDSVMSSLLDAAEGMG